MKDSAVIEKVSQSLEKPYTELLERLPLETKVNIDETGHKENKEKFWTWVFKAELYVLFKIDKSRGSQVLVEVLGKEFNFKIIHEHDKRQPDSFKEALEEAKKNIMAVALEDVPSKINENGKEEKREAKNMAMHTLSSSLLLE